MSTVLFVAGILSAIIFLFRVVRYLSTPFLKSIGFYKYYSPLFCTMPFFNNHLDIHLGTSWDFFRAGKLNPRIILFYLAEGLLGLSKAIEHGEVDGNKILRGNVFYLNSNTFEKFGFTARKLNPAEFVLFLFNYIELCILQSISTGKVTFVSFKNLSILTIKASELIKHSYKIERIFESLSKTNYKENRVPIKIDKPKILKPAKAELLLND